ncbi:MAG TPA: Tad domain-containing protein [Acidimicrobiales bacterium]|nr:Tad domain-containing protein [Acidimicrobiales bacterium]
MRRVKDERGAAAVFMAFLLVALIGMAALVVDVGALYQERRELQNGTDAAALAIAEECALGLIPCVSGVTIDGIAAEYASANAGDGISDAAIDLDDFDPTGRVTVIGTTRDGASGQPFLSHLFAPILGIDSSTVEARSTVIWGVPTSLRSIPLIIGQCEYDMWKPPDLDSDGDATTIFFQGGDGGGKNEETSVAEEGGDTCPLSSSGQDLPGGFGWLDDAAGCESTTVQGFDASVQTGATPKSCSALDLQEMVGTVIAIPIFESFSGTGTNATYLVSGYSGFRLTGYRLDGGNNAFASDPPPDACSSPTKNCIVGSFTGVVVDTPGEVCGSGDGCQDFGATLIRLIK